MNASGAVTLLMTSVLVLSACADSAQTDSAGATADTLADTQQSAGAPGMSGMGMAGMQSAGMMDQLTSYMQNMQDVSADSMRVMMPAHRQLGENMLVQMNREMRAMSMQPDAQWSATADSVGQDLKRMAEMGAAELQAWLPEHRARMTRLMDMHRSMMGGMQH